MSTIIRYRTSSGAVGELLFADKWGLAEFATKPFPSNWRDAAVYTDCAIARHVEPTCRFAKVDRYKGLPLRIALVLR